MALACIARLKEYQNVQVKRLDDSTGVSDIALVSRTNIANGWGADALVSIHHNANAGKWGTHGGVETFIQENTASKASKTIATTIHPRIVQVMGLKDRGVRTKNLHMLREANMPAILTEGGFMDSTIDILALRDKSKLQTQGREIADGLANYFNLKLLKEDVPMAEQYNRNDKPSPTLTTELKLAIAEGITDGTYPTRPATRQEVAVMVYRATKKK